MLDYTLESDVALLTYDDGKANTVGHTFLDEINDALDRAEAEARAVLFTGRDGMFSGGFDLKELKKGPEQTAALVHRGANLFLRLFSFPLPFVAAASGHAIAAGAFMLLASDTRIGASGDFRIGLNETAIGMTLPAWGLELVQARLSNRYQTAAFVQARLYDPEEAREAGFLDEVVAPDQLFELAKVRASTLATLPVEAYAANKRTLRQSTITAISHSVT